MLSPIIHIGYPKTGTTWYQKHYYPQLQNCRYFSRNELIRLLIDVDALTFNPQKVRKQFEQLAEGKRIVICEELLLGGLDIPFGNGEFIKVMADKLVSVFPDATIIVFIRNQAEMLASAYFQYIRSGGTYSIDYYLRLKNRFNPFYKTYLLPNLNNFKYKNIIDYYSTIYSSSKVQVYLFEEFRSQPAIFLEHFKENLQVQYVEDPKHSIVENLRFNKLYLTIMRFTNHFSYLNTARKNYWVNIPYLYYNILRFLTWSNKFSIFNSLRKTDYILGKKRINYIKTYYNENNKELSRYISLKKLAECGYVDESK